MIINVFVEKKKSIGRPDNQIQATYDIDKGVVINARIINPRTGKDITGKYEIILEEKA